MRKTREEKAITLIALIITIVVLLILAVVAINAVTGDGIIQHATNARSEYEKAQGEEEDMLAYYEGVLQSGEVVPTVEQLQEKYKFEYYASLSDAIKKVNGETVSIVSKENAVAGIYTENENKYVVLMKDTEESTTININESVTINLGGKTLSLVADIAYLKFGADTVCTIDGRIGGSTIQKEVDNGTSYGIIDTVEGSSQNDKDSLTINSGKYIIKGKYSGSVFAFSVRKKKLFIDNIEMVAKNITSEPNVSSGIGGIGIKVEESVINNLKILIDADKTVSAIAFASGRTTINNSNIYANTSGTENIVRGLFIQDGSNAEVIVNNTDVYTDAPNNLIDNANYKYCYSVGIDNYETLRFYSGTVTGTLSGLYTGNQAKTYIYGGTFEGYGVGGFNLCHHTAKGFYAENVKIINGEYTGKHNSVNFDRQKQAAMTKAQIDSEIYLDSCTIIGEKKAISSYGTINISNSNITGEIEIPAGNVLNLGKGMSDNLNISGGGSINKTGLSYKGYDKTVAEN